MRANSTRPLMAAFGLVEFFRRRIGVFGFCCGANKNEVKSHHGGKWRPARFVCTCDTATTCTKYRAPTNALPHRKG